MQWISVDMFAIPLRVDVLHHSTQYSHEISLSLLSCLLMRESFLFVEMILEWPERG